MDHFRALKRDRIRIQALGWLFEEATVSRDDLNDLEKAFQSLPELEQDILRLRFLGDMSLKEVAQVLQQTEGGLKSRYYRCLEKLQLSMEGKHDEL
jgi:RNA polymerase sigma-70 factor (ECF subfamily)